VCVCVKLFNALNLVDGLKSCPTWAKVNFHARNRRQL